MKDFEKINQEVINALNTDDNKIVGFFDGKESTFNIILPIELNEVSNPIKEVTHEEWIKRLKFPLTSTLKKSIYFTKNDKVYKIVKDWDIERIERVMQRIRVDNYTVGLNKEFLYE